MRPAPPPRSSSEDISVRLAQNTQGPSSVASIEPDQVRVRWDTSAHLRIYQFVNQSGGLILQVPSEQMLGVTRGIQESLQNELLRQENSRQAEATAEAAGISGARNNGN